MKWELSGLFERHAAEISRFLRRRGHSVEAAADLTQEAFLRFMKTPQDVVIGNPASYLFRTAVNLAIDQQRRGRIAHFIADPDPAIAMLVDEAPSPQRVMESREQFAILQAAIAELPERRRRIFIMSRIENLPYRAIAEKFGVTVRTVENEIMRAMSHCAARIQGETQPD